MIDSANYGAGAAVAPTGTKRHQIASSASRLRRPALPTEPRWQSKLFDGDWSYRFHNTKKYRHPVTGAALKVDAPEEQQRIAQEKDLGARRAAIKGAKKKVSPTKKKTTPKATSESPVTKQGKGEANSTNAPKHRHGSRPWLKERVANLQEVVRDLREAVPELPRPLGWVPDHPPLRSIEDAREVLGHVVRIAHNPVEVTKVSLALVKLWNQQKGEQLEGKYCSESLMSKVNEAVACELVIDRWANVIKAISRKDHSWFTRFNFDRLISTRDGRPDGLEDLEQQEGLSAWGPEAPEEKVGAP